MIAFGFPLLVKKPWMIVLLNADRTSLRDLTTEAMSECDLEDWAPTWSPDGAQLAFTRNLHHPHHQRVRRKPDGVAGNYGAITGVVAGWHQDRVHLTGGRPLLVHLNKTGSARSFA